MRIIERNGNVYARHWFKWYWVVGSSLIKIELPKCEECGK